MKWLIVLILTLAASSALATTYYVKNGGNDGLAGTSDGTAWNSVSKVNGWSFNPGDVVCFKRGSVWHETLSPSVDGQSGNPIVYRDYGSGALPKFDASGVPTGGSWSDQGSNIWLYHTSVGALADRVALGAREYPCADQTGHIDSYHRFFNDGDGNLYVYSTSNPSSAYSSIVLNDARELIYQALYVSASYITFKNLEFYSGACCIQASGGDYVVMDSCTMFALAGSGMVIEEQVNASYWEIKNSVLDITDTTHHDFSYSNRDMMNLQGGTVDHWDIHNNEIANGHHATITLGYTSKSSGSVSYNKIHDNYIHWKSYDYGRGIGMVATVAGVVSHNEVYRNKIVGMSTAAQVGGDHNKFYYNIWDSAGCPSWSGNSGSPAGGYPEQAGIVIKMDDNSEGVINQDNVLVNNLFMNGACPAIKMGPSSGVCRDTIMNNIFYNNGNNIPSVWGDPYTDMANVQLYVVGDIACGSYCIKNNVFYDANSTSNIIWDGWVDGTHRTAAWLNSNADHNSVASGNISTDPVIGTDYKIGESSVAKDAGRNYTIGGAWDSKDYFGNLVNPLRDAPDIGVHEYIEGGPPPDTLATVVTGTKTSVTSSGATLHGTIDANSTSTTGRVLYGTTTTYSDSANCAENPVTGTTAANVSAAISGLSASTAYHYKLAGSNAAGYVRANYDSTFTTSSAGGGGPHLHAKFISISGNDSYSGRMPDSAWATLAKVKSSANGDSVLLKRGDTWNEILDVPNVSGTASAHVYYGTYGTGAKPIIDAEGGTRDYCIDISYEDLGYLTFDSLDLRGADVAAVFRNETGGTGVILNALDIRDCNTHGISIRYIDSVTVRNCTLRQIGLDPVEGNPSGHAIYVTVSDHSLIEHNDIDSCLGAGIHSYLGLNQTIRYNIVKRCINTSGEYGILVWTNAAATVDVYYNYVYGCYRRGLSVRDCASGSTANVYNNVFASAYGEDGTYCTNNGGSTINMKNNIFAFNTGGYDVYIDDASGTYTLDYNNYYRSSGNTVRKNGSIYAVSDSTAARAGGFGSHSLFSDPLFVAIATDGKIQNGSPCKDAGTNLGLTPDLYGNTAPYNTVTDIGVHEYAPAHNAWYVATNGGSGGAGTINDPWDIFTWGYYNSTPQPGDTVNLRGGIYYTTDGTGQSGSGTVYSTISGTAALPIIVRSYPGEWAVIDEGTHPNDDSYIPGAFSFSGSYVWYRDFEIMSSDTARVSTSSNTWPPDISRGNLVESGSGTGNKLINLILHDGANGMYIDYGADLEVNGCISYNNGWVGPDRGHGHAFYANNIYPHVKVFKDCIGWGMFDINLTLYGSTSNQKLDHIIVNRNVFFENSVATAQCLFYGGESGSGVAHHPLIENNLIYSGNGAIALNVGAYSYGNGSDSLELLNNYISGVPVYFMTPFTNQTVTGNTFNKTTDWANFSPGSYPNNTYAANPTGTHVVVALNDYQTKRANIVIFNYDMANTVNVDVSSILGVGDSLYLRDVQNYWGTPILAAVYTGGSITIPMTGTDITQPVHRNCRTHTTAEFGAFVLSSHGTSAVPGSSVGSTRRRILLP
jgi:hypothetical protein